MLGVKRSLFSFGKTLGIDFILRHSPDFILGDPFLDGLRAFIANDLTLWVLQDPNSSLATRQMLSSFYHFSRCTLSGSFSAADFLASWIVKYIFPSSETLSPEKSKKRALSRMVKTMQLNGGVYQDLAEIISSECGVTPPKTNESPKFIQKLFSIFHSKPRCLSEKELSEMYFKETGRSFTEDFTDFDSNAFVSGPLYTHDVLLRGGIKGRLSYVPPVIKRMRKYDLFPLYLLTKLSPSGYSQLFEAIYNNLDYSIQKEICSRVLLSGLHSRFIIPQPITMFCSENIMVIEAAPPEIKTTASSRNIISAFSQAALGHGILIGNLNPSNIVHYEHGIGLRRYSPLVQTSHRTIPQILQFSTSLYFNDIETACHAAEKLHLNSWNVRQVKENPHPLIKDVLRHYSPEIVSLLTASGGISYALQNGSIFSALPFLSHFLSLDY